MSGRPSSRWYKLTCAALLIAAVLLSAAWVGSYRRALEIRFPAPQGSAAMTICCYRGLTSVMWMNDSPTRRAGSISLYDGTDSLRATLWDQLYWDGTYAGVSFAEGVTWISDRREGGFSRPWTGFTLPVWLLVLFLVILPAVRLCALWRRHHRAALGQCRDCGYDLGGLSIDCPACTARAAVIGASPRTHLIPT